MAFLQFMFSVWAVVVEIGLALFAEERPHAKHVRTLPEGSLELKKKVLQFEGLSITSLLDYRDRDTEACIRALKYENSRRAATLLAEVLTRHIEILPRHELPTRIVAIPLHRTRLVDRGYNQCERVLSAVPSALLKEKNLFICKDMLRRTRITQQQTKLDKEARAHNMRNAFEATKAYDDTLVYLLDDVVTTGATLQDAMRALKATGVQEIACIVLARA